MSPSSMGTGAPKDSANLARIRDNQRRSRARRKEYIQDLEARLRRVELQGVEAATEIQLAARRVADENRRLRTLLYRHGVGDDAIEGYLARGDTGEAAVGRAVGRLEQLLVPRRPSCGSLGLSAKPESRESFVASESGRNNGWEAVTRHSSGDVSPLSGRSRQMAGAFPSPPATSATHPVGIYSFEVYGGSGNSPYSIEYGAAIQTPRVQLSSPQEYDSVSADYFVRPRGFSHGQYP